MMADDIEAILMEHADEELRVGMSNGEYINIRHPGEVRISGLKMWVFTGLQAGKYVTTGPVRYLSIVNIATITPVAQRQPPHSN